MAKTSQKEITTFIDTFLAVTAYEDGCFNGLQVAGAEHVARVGLAVDSGRSVFEAAAASEINYLIVHHGLFWRGVNPSLIRPMRNRITPLLTSDCSLYACHLPLDGHPQVGNNVQILKTLGVKELEPFSYCNDMPLGWMGRMAQPSTFEAALGVLTQKLGKPLAYVEVDEKKIEKIAVISGGASYRGLAEAAAAGADLFITGDTAEAYHMAQDWGMHAIFLGHYQTEVVGIQALADRLETEFADCEVTVIDQPTGL